MTAYACDEFGSPASLVSTVFLAAGLRMAKEGLIFADQSLFPSVVGTDALQFRASRLHRNELRADLVFDFLGDFGVGLEEVTRVVLALSDAFTVVAVPGTGLLDDAL